MDDDGKESDVKESDAFGIKCKSVLNSSASFMSIQQRKDSSRIEFDDQSAKDLKNESFFQEESAKFPNNASENLANLKVNQKVHRASVDLQSRVSVFSRRKGVHHKSGFTSQIWTIGALRIVYYVSKFVVLLLTSIEKIKFKLMEERVFNLIGDKCANYEFYRQLGMVKEKPGWLDRMSLRYARFGRLINYLKTLPEIISKHFLVILPENKFKVYIYQIFLKIIFDIILTLVLSFNMIYIPLNLSFQLYTFQSDYHDILLNQLPNYFQIFEILINFNTAFYEQGKIITSRRLIFQHYIKNDFLLDTIITVLPIIMDPFLKFSKLILMVRFYRIRSSINQLILVLNLRDRFSQIISLAKMMYMMIMISHILACCWYYVARFEEEYLFLEKTWLTVYSLDNEQNWVVIYLNALYWAVITANTIGYGDITPQTTTERAFVMIATVFTSVSFGFMISSMGSIFAQMNESDELYLKKMALINSYIKKRGLSEELQLKVRMYFEYYLKQNNDEEVNQLLMQVPQDLQKEVTIDLFEKYLIKAKFIENSITQKTVKSLCLIAKERKFQPEEVIMRQGETVDRLIIVLGGELESFTSKHSLRRYKKGYVIAERNFLSQTPLMYSIKSIRQSLILEITFDDLISVLKESQEDIEKFAMVQLNIKQNTSYKKFTDICEVCWSNHDLSKCPFPFFQRNEKKVIKLLNTSQINKRDKQNRKDMKFAVKNQQFFIAQQSFRICRMEYLSSALQYCLDSEQLTEDAISSEFLSHIGFPLQNQLKSNQESNSSSSSEDSERVSKKQEIKLVLDVIMESKNSHSEDEESSRKSEKKQQQVIQRKPSQSHSRIIVPENAKRRISSMNGNNLALLQKKNTQESLQRKVYNLKEIAQRNRIDQFQTQSSISQVKQLQIEFDQEKRGSLQPAEIQLQMPIEEMPVVRSLAQIKVQEDRRNSTGMLDEIMKEYQEIIKNVTFDEIDLQA